MAQNLYLRNTFPEGLSSTRSGNHTHFEPSKKQTASGGVFKDGFTYCEWLRVITASSP